MTGVAGKTIIITGASSGIGEATALELAGSGAQVMLAARREDRLKALASQITAAGGAADFLATDVTQLSQQQALAATAIQRFGKIDVLFANAGVMPLTLLRNMQIEQWDQTIDVNIKGVLYGIAAVLPHMLERGDGHIILTSSVAGHGVWPGYAVYSGTKWAVLAIAEGLRQETGDKVRVTVISPGIVKTELADHITDPEILPTLAGRFQHFLEAEDIARAVRYAIEQPRHVEVNEVLVRALGQAR